MILSLTLVVCLVVLSLGVGAWLAARQRDGRF
jgi:hypothetical protein